MNFFPIRSLETISVLKVVTMLWNQEAVKILLIRLNLKYMDLDDMPRDWRALENVVIKSVKNLSLPKPIEDRALSVIVPVGLEILRWNNFHNRYLTKVSIERKEVTNKLIWSSNGSINRKKTAQKLVQKAYLDISRRYALACAYCFEKYILTLIQKIPESKMKYFYVEGDPNKVNQDLFVVYWTYRIKGELNLLNDYIESRSPGYTLDENMFHISAIIGNTEATKYFYQRISEDRRQHCLVKVIDQHIDKFDFSSNICDRSFLKLKKYSKSRREEFSVLFYLFTKLTKEEQKNLLKKGDNELFILVALLVWPYKNIFIETLEKLHSEREIEIDFCGLFHCILKMSWKEMYSDDQELLRGFWRLMPACDKSSILEKIEDDSRSSLFQDLLYFSDCKTLWTVLKDATAKQRENILFSKTKALKNLIFNGEWEKIKFYIPLCISSKNILVIFKDTMNRDKRHMFKNMQDKEAKQSQFFELLDNFLQE